MKNTIIQMMLVVGLVACSAGFAHAQISAHYTTQIPFDFTVGKKHYAAGVYSIEVRGTGQRVFVLRNADGNNSYAFSTTPGNWNQSSAEALDFYRVGDQYFLAAIRLSDLTSRVLPAIKSRPALYQKDVPPSKVTLAVAGGK